MSEQKPTTSPSPPKPPYEPPAVVSEETFETLALACAKASSFSCGPDTGNHRS